MQFEKRKPAQMDGLGGNFFSDIIGAITKPIGDVLVAGKQRDIAKMQYITAGQQREHEQKLVAAERISNMKKLLLQQRFDTQQTAAASDMLEKGIYGAVALASVYFLTTLRKSK